MTNAQEERYKFIPTGGTDADALTTTGNGQYNKETDKIDIYVGPIGCRERSLNTDQILEVDQVK